MSTGNQYRIVWSNASKGDLKTIYKFIKRKSLQGAKNVISDIRKAPKSIHFSEQTEVEAYFPECRRIIVRNYKVLYQINEADKTLNIIRIFDTRQDPLRLTMKDF